jgi:NADPH:quinone reductase-like Zn-dependent oxidoreductase
MDFGGPDVLRVVELPVPEPGPGELRLRVQAAAINPADVSIRVGLRRDWVEAGGPPPYVPGMDAAGVVDRIGDDTDTDLRVGDEAMAVVRPKGSHGAYAEYVVVPAPSAVRIPKGTTVVEAATLPMNGLTARQALDVLGLEPGQTIAVVGAAGALGGFAVQLAKAAGLRVVADASPADAELVRSLGADVVVPRGSDVAERIREAVPDGVDGLVDGAVLDAAVFPAVRDAGRVATVKGFAAEGPRGITATPVSVSTYVTRHDLLEQLRRQVERGEVKPRVAGTVEPDDVPSAHRRFEAGGTRGRFVIVF